MKTGKDFFLLKCKKNVTIRQFYILFILYIYNEKIIGANFFMDPIKQIYNVDGEKYPPYNPETIDSTKKGNNDANVTFEGADNLKMCGSIFMLDERLKPTFKMSDSGINITEIFNGEFSTGTSIAKPENYVEILAKTNKYSSLVEMDNKGNIIAEQFTIEGIKKRFNEKDYKISIEHNDGHQWVTIKDKKTDKKIREYSIPDFSEEQNVSASIHNYDNDEVSDESVGVHFVKDKGLFMGSVYKRDKDDVHSTYITFEYASKNIHELRRYEKQSKYDEYGKEISDTYYSNGKPYQTIYPDGSIHNYLVDELIPILKNRSFSGEIKEQKAYMDALEQINPKNVYNILVDFKKQTGKDLLDELDEKGRKTVQNAMGQCESREGDRENEINYIVDKLMDDIYGLGSGNLKEDIYYLTNYNIQDVLIRYRQKTREKHQEYLDKPYINDWVADKMAPEEGLIEAIMRETGLSEDEKKSIMRYILIPEKDADVLGGRNFISYIYNENAMKDIMFLGTDYICDLFDNVYVDDIKADMIVNKNNSDRFKTDIKRLVNRGTNKSDKKVTKPNGIIDITTEQGNTGDCWLLAGLISMYKKPKGKELLESLIQVNPQTGDVTVTLKGVNKEYTIKSEEIKNANYLSGGDGDIRAIELAFDKYMRETAYSTTESYAECDINGNTCSFMYSILLGKKTVEKPYNEFKNKDFNNPNKYYTMGVSDFKVKDFKAFENAMINEKGEPVDMITGHAYAVIKSDKKYVYVVNPWNSGETLRITHEKIKELDVDLGCSCA